MATSMARRARSVPAFGHPVAFAMWTTRSARVIYMPNVPRASSITASVMVETPFYSA